MKKILIASISTLVVITACAAVIYHLLAADPQVYYTRIDNTCVKEIDDDDMGYEYALPAYQRNGEKKI